jgi:diaminohydroxyphosphoribosylaminopyrimidine deaminase/5-amino-6-(5-phosphoribosylamino)uracil reductase
MDASLKTADREYLRRALELAERGRGRVSPNPLVGAVIVRDGEVIGEGFHAELGDLHAERAALADCASRGEDPGSATMFVTLEPCAHQGRQPPCVDAILEAGIGRVVIASDDPSEKAAGRGPGMLRDSEVKVDFAAGEEATAARLLNQPFRKHARTGLPLVTLKLAMSLDGQTETPPGDSSWISGPESQQLVHRWRAESDAIAVGIGTVLADDPLLTARPAASGAFLAPIEDEERTRSDFRQPVRVVFDRQARLPLDSQLLQTLDQSPVLVVVSQAADQDRVAALRDAGAEILVADDIAAALSDLGRRNVTSLFLEGGRTLVSAFLAMDAIDESRTFIAPILLGDPEGGTGGAPPAQRRPVFRPKRDLGRPPEPQAKNPASGRGTPGPALHHEAEPIGDDVLITARFKEW